MLTTCHFQNFKFSKDSLLSLEKILENAFLYLLKILKKQ